MKRWRAAAIGAAAFLAAHVVIVWQWPMLAGGHASEPAWFANSTGSIVAMVIAMAAAGLGAARGSDHSDERRHNISHVAAGAIAAMTGTMMIVGGGSIAPLAFIIGGAVLVAGTFAGGIIASLIAAPR